MKQNGIILEGGAMRSVFEAGVLDFFMEKGIEISNVLAVSAGAYAGMNYVSGQKGRMVDAVIKPLEHNKYIGFSTFLKKGTFFDMDYFFDKIPKLLSPFDFETFKNSTKRFLMNTVDCNTGEGIYHEQFDTEENFWKLCRAANSLPFISRVSQIDGRPMMDGGLSEAIPIVKALEEGWEKIIVVLTRKSDYRKRNRYFYMFMMHIIYRKYPELIKTVAGRAKRYNDSLNMIDKLEKEGKALVLRPTELAIRNQEANVDTLMKYYQHGYDTAKEKEEEIRDFLYDR